MTAFHYEVFESTLNFEGFFFNFDPFQQGIENEKLTVQFVHSFRFEKMLSTQGIPNRSPM